MMVDALDDVAPTGKLTRDDNIFTFKVGSNQLLFSTYFIDTYAYSKPKVFQYDAGSKSILGISMDFENLLIAANVMSLVEALQGFIDHRVAGQNIQLTTADISFAIPDKHGLILANVYGFSTYTCGHRNGITLLISARANLPPFSVLFGNPWFNAEADKDTLVKVKDYIDLILVDDAYHELS